MDTPIVNQHHGMSDHMAEVKADKFTNEVIEFQRELSKKLKFALNNSKRKKPFYKVLDAYASVMKSMSIEWHTVGLGKRKFFAVMEISGCNRLALGIHSFHPKKGVIYSDGILVSRHALQRIIQRSTSPNGVRVCNLVAVLMEVVKGTIRLLTDDKEDYKIDVPNIGTFVVYGSKKDLPIIKTFYSFKL